ncbi:MAG: hypothetical protein AB1576_09815 [Bacillota bacterium]
MGEPARRHVSLGEACERLGLGPKTFRNMVDEYREVLGLSAEEDQGLPEERVETLERIVEWRSSGLGPEEIGRLLEETMPSQAPPRSSQTSERLLARVPSHRERALMEQSLPERLERLVKAIGQSESKRLEDRDLMLTAMMRIQQEVRMLRYELRGGTRRERRRGFWSRLFGGG